MAPENKRNRKVHADFRAEIQSNYFRGETSKRNQDWPEGQ